MSGAGALFDPGAGSGAEAPESRASAPVAPLGATCRSCGAPITWAVSTKTRKPTPVDREPSRDGTVQLFEEGGRLLADHTRKADRPGLLASGVLLYANHTCPDREKWGQKSGGPAGTRGRPTGP